MPRFHNVAAALAAFFGLVASAQAASAADIVFPVVVSDPAAREAPLAKGATLTQRVRSDAAVRIAVDTAVAYKPRILDRKMFGAGNGLTLTAGRVFVRALMPDGEAFCAAVAPKAEGLMTFFDVGLCLRDTDHDGVFDLQMVFEPTQRMRTPYEITRAGVLGRVTEWAPTKVPYAAAPAEAIPAGELRISYSSTPINVRGRGQVMLELCWPSELVVPGVVKSGESLCSIIETPGFVVRDMGDEVRIEARAAYPQALNWGAVAIELREEGGRRSMAFSKAWPAGPSRIALAGVFRQPSDKFQRSVFIIAAGTGAP